MKWGENTKKIVNKKNSGSEMQELIKKIKVIYYEKLRRRENPRLRITKYTNNYIKRTLKFIVPFLLNIDYLEGMGNPRTLKENISSKNLKICVNFFNDDLF